MVLLSRIYGGPRINYHDFNKAGKAHQRSNRCAGTNVTFSACVLLHLASPSEISDKSLVRCAGCKSKSALDLQRSWLKHWGRLWCRKNGGGGYFHLRNDVLTHFPYCTLP